MLWLLRLPRLLRLWLWLLWAVAFCHLGCLIGFGLLLRISRWLLLLRLRILLWLWLLLGLLLWLCRLCRPIRISRWLRLLRLLGII